jgi:hypothetical protein
MDKASRSQSMAKTQSLKTKPSLLLTAFLGIIVSSLTHPSFTYAQIFPELVKPDQPNPLSDLEKIFANIINALIPTAGIVLFVMLVIGGLIYLSSGGDPESAQKAKSTITYAIIGIALLVLAWFALLFIETFTGVTVTKFRIHMPAPAPSP